jgi:hypothetical protein
MLDRYLHNDSAQLHQGKPRTSYRKLLGRLFLCPDELSWAAAHVSVPSRVTEAIWWRKLSVNETIMYATLKNRQKRLTIFSSAISGVTLRLNTRGSRGLSPA